jgi:hypothetical protein
MRTLVAGFVATSALLILPSASAKDFGPGDLRVCNATRCVAIVSRDVLPQLRSFYYSGPSPARVRGGLDLVGIALRAKRETVDKIVDRLRFHP